MCTNNKFVSTLIWLFHHFSFHSCCSYWIVVYFRFISHFSIFRCVSHFSIFRFAALRFVIFRFASLRFVIFRFVSFRCISISFRSLVQVVKLLVSRKNGHKAHAVPSTLFTFVRFVKEHFVVLLATTRLYLFQRIKMTNKKYHTVGTVKISNRKIVERGNGYLYHTHAWSLTFQA
jgi:hypothetical protein